MAAPPTTPPTTPGLEHLPRAEEAAAALPPLLLQAERIAATVAHGAHGRRRTGPGDTFWQFRRYHPGDPAQSIDWRQTAKGAHPFVREHEWAAAQTVLLWTAADTGMDWRSADTLPTKLERARVLTLALAILLLDGGERVGLLAPALRPALGRGGLPAMAQTLARAPVEDAAALPPAAAPGRHATVVVIGDLLAPAEAWEARLRALAGQGVRGHLVQILDPAEESLPYTGRVRFEGPAGRDHWLVRRAEDVRAAYVDRLAAHRESLKALARQLGWSFVLHHTDASPQAPLLALYGALSGGR